MASASHDLAGGAPLSSDSESAGLAFLLSHLVAASPRLSALTFHSSERGSAAADEPRVARDAPSRANYSLRSLQLFARGSLRGGGGGLGGVLQSLSLCDVDVPSDGLQHSSADPSAPLPALRSLSLRGCGGGALAAAAAAAGPQLLMLQVTDIGLRSGGRHEGTDRTVGPPAAWQLAAALPTLARCAALRTLELAACCEERGHRLLASFASSLAALAAAGGLPALQTANITVKASMTDTSRLLHAPRRGLMAAAQPPHAAAGGDATTTLMSAAVEGDPTQTDPALALFSDPQRCRAWRSLQALTLGGFPAALLPAALAGLCTPQLRRLALPGYLSAAEGTICSAAGRSSVLQALEAVRARCPLLRLPAEALPPKETAGSARGEEAGGGGALEGGGAGGSSERTPLAAAGAEGGGGPRPAEVAPPTAARPNQLPTSWQRGPAPRGVAAALQRASDASLLLGVAGRGAADNLLRAAAAAADDAAAVEGPPPPDHGAPAAEEDDDSLSAGGGGNNSGGVGTSSPGDSEEDGDSDWKP